MSPMPMNILYLHAHDVGRYVQPYGHAIPTPHLQQLAEGGVLFRQAFCAAPTCSPSRAALLTGSYPHNNGMLGLAHRGWRLDDYGRHLAHTLRGAGYVTALAGVQHLAREPYAAVEELGYDRILTQDGGFDGATAAAVAFLDHPPGRPFFLDVGYHAPHRWRDGFRSLFAPADERYCLPPAPLPDTPETRRDMAQYTASVRSTDASMGRVLAALERAGLAEDTLVIATTDHGIAFPAMKCRLTDHGIGVLLILRGPAGSPFAGGAVVDGLVSHLDLFPTVCALLGIEPPGWLQGAALLPLVRGEAPEVRDAIFAEVNYHAAYEPMRAVRTRRWKYIRRYDDRERVVLPNCDNSPSKALWVDHGWQQRPRPQELLFDLMFDPHEAHNLAPDPRNGEVLADLRRRLDAWMRQTGDPLLRGPIPLTPGGITTDPDDYNPGGGGRGEGAPFADKQSV